MDTPSRVHGNDLALHAGWIVLMLLDDLWLEVALTIPRRTKLNVARLSGNRLCSRFTVAAIASLLVLRVMLGVAQMGIQLIPEAYPQTSSFAHSEYLQRS